MIPFLKRVASAYYAREDIENICFIFPNRRSEVFFVKYLSDLVCAENRAGKKRKPMLVPGTSTVNDFIYGLYGIRPTDRVTLLLELYKVYCEVFPGAEPLDDFIFWGDIIIGDFNDVDKYMADASQLFTNIADLKSLQDSYEYLTERQRQAVEAFVSHFSDSSGRLTVDLKSDNPKVKEKFLQIWNMLYPLYVSYRERLAGKGMAYEGMVYRRVAERMVSESAGAVLEKAFPRVARYVFVGLNALNECEKTVMRKMQQSALAEFCWDYSGKMISDRYNKSSFFMRENIKEFPQTVMFDEDDSPVPEIRVISVPSTVGQVKLLPGIFREIAGLYTGGDLSRVGVLSQDSLENVADCAVVLPDENLLMPVLNTIPYEIRDINVTMGYPLSSGSFYMFMELVAGAQMNMRRKGDVWYFYHKQVRSVFSDSIFRTAAGKDGQKLMEEIKSAGQSYIPASALDAGGIFSAVFRPAVTDRTAASAEVTDALASYLLEVIESAVSSLRGSAADRLELESAAEFHRTVKPLMRMHLEVRPQTWLRVLKQILQPVSVPFKGEPLQGLQIMGPLETRALDFGNLVIMSANEGIFPRRSVSSSFIPPELRRGFGLPTYEYQDAVWAYYFYRMLSRAKNVWLLYDSRTEGLKSGEESRYIKQLQYHFRIPLKRYVVSAALAEMPSAGFVPKTEEDVKTLENLEYSASSLLEYMSCPARFFYHKVKGLGREEDVAEELDAGLFGTVYHEVMRCLYLPSGSVLDEVSGTWIKSWLGRTPEIREKVRKVMMRELNTIDITGKNLVTMDVIVQYVMKTLSADLELLKRSGRESFRIIGLEKYFRIRYDGFTIHGIVDRIDSFSDGEIRVVDYKTGNVDDRELAALYGPPSRTAEAVYHSATKKQRPGIAFQLYIYDKFMSEDPVLSGYSLSNAVYSTRRLFRELPDTCRVAGDFVPEMDSGLSELFREMTDISVPFRLTDDTDVCRNCDFKSICGR